MSNFLDYALAELLRTLRSRRATICLRMARRRFDMDLVGQLQEHPCSSDSAADLQALSALVAEGSCPSLFVKELRRSFCALNDC